VVASSQKKANADRGGTIFLANGEGDALGSTALLSPPSRA